MPNTCQKKKEKKKSVPPGTEVTPVNYRYFTVPGNYMMVNDHPEQSGSKVRQVTQQLRKGYNSKFKLMVIKAVETSNNSQAAKKYGVSECTVRRWF